MQLLSRATLTGACGPRAVPDRLSRANANTDGGGRCAVERSRGRGIPDAPRRGSCPDCGSADVRRRSGHRGGTPHPQDCAACVLGARVGGCDDGGVAVAATRRANGARRQGSGPLTSKLWMGGGASSWHPRTRWTASQAIRFVDLERPRFRHDGARARQRGHRRPLLDRPPRLHHRRRRRRMFALPVCASGVRCV